MAFFEYVAKPTAVHRLNPVTKLAVTGAIVVSATLLRDFFSLSLILAITLGWWYWSKIPVARFKYLLSLSIATITVIVIGNAFLFVPPRGKIAIEIYSGWWFNPLAMSPQQGLAIYLDGIVFGLATGIKIMAMVCALPVLVTTTPIPSLMTAMSRFRIPYKFNFILGSALRFAPLFYSNFATITDAQKLRGHDMDKMKLLEKVMKGYVPIVTPLVLLLLRSSDDMQIAIESRAFGAPVKRTYVEELRMSRLDYLVAGFSLGLVLVTIYGVVTQGSLVPVGLIPYWAKPA